jgi:hypothetical protein
MGRSQTGRPEGPRPLNPVRCRTGVSSGITGTFAKAPCGAPLSLCPRYVTHVLLTRPPLNLLGIATKKVPYDLHALATPPAFVLSQDQTLLFNRCTDARPRYPFEYRYRAPVDFDSSHLAHRSAWLGRIGRLASSSSNPSSGPEPHVLTAVDHTHCSLVKELVRGPQAGLPANWPEHRMLSGALALSIGQSPELFRSIHFLPLASSHCKTRRKNNPV